MVSIFDRLAIGANQLAHAWNAFTNAPQESNVTRAGYGGFSGGGGSNPARIRSSAGSDRTISTSVYNRIAIDASTIELNHVYQDENKRYLRDADSGLANILTLRANIDQYATAFQQDIYMSLFEHGVIALVPIDTSDVPLPSGSYDIFTMRVGEIIKWSPRHVRVRVYNDVLGRREELTLSKSLVAIIENPLYSVMNEPNSTLQRLLRKLSLLDSVDEAASSGKLDMIIQLPYTIKTDARREQANLRARDIESQLKGSKYGIAYTDATEKIVQLNRPVENNMQAEIASLTSMFYAQLGLSASVFDGTADEKTMLNYYNRTIEPLLRAVAEAMKATFLTKTARTQGQSIEYFRDPFRLLAISDLADIADKLTRNEILSSNEFRGIIGFKPAADPNANALLNKNLPIQAQPGGVAPVDPSTDLGELTAIPSSQSVEEPQIAPPDTDEQTKIFNDAMQQIQDRISSIVGGGEE